MIRDPHLRHVDGARQPPPHLTNGAGGLRLQRRDRPQAGGDPTLGSGPPSAVSRAQEWGQHPGVPRSRARVATVGVPGPAPQQGHSAGPLLSRQKTALPTSLDLSDPWPAGTSNHVRGDHQETSTVIQQVCEGLSAASWGPLAARLQQL